MHRAKLLTFAKTIFTLSLILFFEITAKQTKLGNIQKKILYDNYATKSNVLVFLTLTLEAQEKFQSYWQFYGLNQVRSKFFKKYRIKHFRFKNFENEYKNFLLPSKDKNTVILIAFTNKGIIYNLQTFNLEKLQHPSSSAFQELTTSFARFMQLKKFNQNKLKLTLLAWQCNRFDLAKKYVRHINRNSLSLKEKRLLDDIVTKINY